jgi:site-specific recombinase XerC
MTAERRKQGPRPKKAPKPLTIREITVERNGSSYRRFRVEGYRDSDTGKRRLREFSDRAEATRFVAEQEIAAANREPIRSVITRLTPDQIAQAESAFSRLGESHTLDEAVSHFLAKVAPPEKPIDIKAGLVAFLIAKEQEGLREQSLKQLEHTLGRFRDAVHRRGVIHLHECDAATVETFLRSLRAKGGVEKASPKTWNNFRADLSSFFTWCRDPRRRWIALNPCEGVAKIKLDGTGEPDILTVKQAARLMRDVEQFQDGKLIRYFALALFAGIRPGSKGELYKLARHPDREKLIDLNRGIITIPPEVSKTRRKRQIVIRPALRAWLEATGPEIIPTNSDRLLKEIRKRHELSHDVLRHSFISFHVGAFRSIGDAALEAGNTEGVIKAHYLNIVTEAQGKAFWRLAPRGRKIPKYNDRKTASHSLRIVA